MPFLLLCAEHDRVAEDAHTRVALLAPVKHEREHPFDFLWVHLAAAHDRRDFSQAVEHAVVGIALGALDEDGLHVFVGDGVFPDVIVQRQRSSHCFEFCVSFALEVGGWRRWGHLEEPPSALLYLS